ncbi:MAG: ATP-grasp domain-containing protein, partial [Paludibacteraceae bacterium]|nr:ATP-grasp domain-containing protein [Paludibacteraceae bacterium]
DFLKEVNKVMNLQNFPIHIEFRYDGKKAVPIEINPLRFAGFCLNELQYYISGIHPVEAYLNGIKPDYESMWKGRENDTYTFLVLERPEGSTTETLVDKQKVYDYFENILQFRVPQDKNVNVLALLFTQTSPKNLHQLDDLLAMNMNEFVLK